MSAHNCREITEGCYRCELNRDEIEANRAVDATDAQAAWIEYRDDRVRRNPWLGADRASRQMRRREFIAGFIAGREA